MNGRILKNISWIVICKLAQSIISLIIGMISARYLGPSNYGIIAYASSVVTFIVPIMELGLSKTLVLEFIERPKEEGLTLGTALLLNVISAVACILGISVFFYFSNLDDRLVALVGILYSTSLLFQATEILQYWFQAKLLSKNTSIATLIAYSVVSVYKIFLLVTQKPVTWFALSNSLDYLIISMILLVSYRKQGTQRLRVSRALGKSMLSKSKHYILSAMMVNIWALTDRIMLKHMIGNAETGYYSAALVCISVTGFVFSAIIDSMRPAILEAKADSKKMFEDRMILLYCIVTYLALLQSIGMTVFAKPLVLILYGKDYLNSIPPLRVAVWFTTFSYYGTVRNIWILAEKQQQYLWKINCLGAIMNIALNLLLIPRCQAVGAAIASLISQFFTNVIISYLIKATRYNSTLMLKGLNPKHLFNMVKQFNE